MANTRSFVGVMVVVGTLVVGVIDASAQVIGDVPLAIRAVL